jgi:hypothetical protein
MLRLRGTDVDDRVDDRIETNGRDGQRSDGCCVVVRLMWRVVWRVMWRALRVHRRFLSILFPGR